MEDHSRRGVIVGDENEGEMKSEYESACAPLALPATQPSKADPHGHRQQVKTDHGRHKSSVVDHRDVGTAQSLFTTDITSPGAPFFQPDGTHIFQKLVSFLRAQYPHFGFREVLTPTMYKEALWETSGHWANYKDAMFSVKGTSSRTINRQSLDGKNKRLRPGKDVTEATELESYGLKPMNCPGHCLLYGSERRSYRDLPIRYAEFSPLHRNEMSGALGGLTRVRQFHQDDGHIFCRPGQVKEELEKSLAFVKMVYETLDLHDYRLVLSTRPGKGFMGNADEWNQAETQLKVALNDEFGSRWRTRVGEGAFYGPKIDIVLRDGNGKEHQTGTIQLDFQLPKRFELTYESPSPELEARGEDWVGSGSRTALGKVVPVMIHRAIYGSLERFMALLLEKYRGQLPFWLSPNQVFILTVGDMHHVNSYAKAVKMLISNEQSDQLPRILSPPLCTVDIDDSADSISQKIVRAKKKKYNIICVVGARNAKEGALEDTVDVDIAAQPNQRKTWEQVENVKPGSRAPVQKDKGTGFQVRGYPGVRLSLSQCRGLIKRLNRHYC